MAPRYQNIRVTIVKSPKARKQEKEIEKRMSAKALE